MANPAPLEWGQFYHIWNRGNNRENVFQGERDYHHFLKLYAEHIQSVAETYAYCLLRNHFHLLIRVREQDEVRAMTGERSALRKPSQCFSNLFNAHVRSVNRPRDRTGSLFQRPFGRKRVTSDEYLLWLVIYIHRNPQKHHFVPDFREWPYSSYHPLLATQPTRLQREEVMGWFDGVARFSTLHQQDVDEGRIAALIDEDFD